MKFGYARMPDIKLTVDLNVELEHAIAEQLRALGQNAVADQVIAMLSNDAMKPQEALTLLEEHVAPHFQQGLLKAGYLPIVQAAIEELTDQLVL